jgi:UDP-glucose 6-dehydrogenase
VVFIAISIPLITSSLGMCAKVPAYDPAGMEQAGKDLPNIAYCEDAYACARGADALVIVTEGCSSGHRTRSVEADHGTVHHC